MQRYDADLLKAKKMCGGRPASGVSEPPGDPPRAMLESGESRGREQQAQDVGFGAECCGSRFCHRCGPVKGRRLRDRARSQESILARFQSSGLITFTVAQTAQEGWGCKGFSGPEEAYEYVTSNRFVGRALRAVGVTDWIWVLELQANGWPHWHVLCGWPGWVDYKLLRELWANQWGIGVQIRVEPPTKIHGASHGLNYVFKYLTKPRTDEGGMVVDWPEWCLKSHRRIRMVGSSRSIGALVGRLGRSQDVGPEEVTPGDEDLAIEGSDEETQSVSEAVRRERCGGRTVVWRRCGEKWQFVAVLPVRVDRLWEAAAGIPLPELAEMLGPSWADWLRIDVRRGEDGRILGGRLLWRGGLEDSQWRRVSNLMRASSDPGWGIAREQIIVEAA